ncbi:hypothetical protein ACFQZF_09290 [Flavobacterium myungsuense]|uniref:hypothetical protein n=1 Tax=Flavobacterium myungsuense TaxID=651823 RepID=UPI00362CE041
MIINKLEQNEKVKYCFKKSTEKTKKNCPKKEAKSVLHPQNIDISNQLQKDSENSSNDKILIKASKMNNLKDINFDNDILEGDFELPTDISDFGDDAFDNENDYYETPIDDF